MIRGDNWYDAKLRNLAAQHSECMGFMPRFDNPEHARGL
jgi:hypothetical protein